MPVPSTITDLSTIPASNSPAGSETPSSTDDYLRTLSAFIKQAYDAAISDGAAWASTAGGTANALTLTPAPAIAAYAAGQVFRFLAATTNTGAVTVAVSGLTAIALQVNGAACVGGEIVAGQWYELLLSSSSVAQLRTTAAPNLTTAINFKRATVAAAATTTPVWLPSNGNVQDWTGVVTITDFPAAPQAGAKREVYPAAGAIMTHGGNISVQGNVNHEAAAGDKWIVTAITTTTFYVEVVKKDGLAVATISKGQQLFTSSGSWVCPAGVTTVYISGAGAGGGGGGGGASPGGGGGGAAVLESPQTVVPGNTYTVTIGTGGAGAAGTGATGGTTSFGALVTLPGGGGGTSANAGGASGGTGGGSGGPSTQAGYGGGGGGTIFGSGGAPSGGSASLYGGGGSGIVSGTGTNGADGFILVRW